MRNFSAYTKTAPAVPTVSSSTLGGAAVSLGACNLMTLDGVLAAGATVPCWLQIFDASAAPSGGDVPAITIEIDSAGPIPSYFATQPFNLYKGFYVAISSTAATYTALGNTFSVWGQVEDNEILTYDSLSTAGDLTTGVDKLEVFAAAVGPRKLNRVDVINSGAAHTLMLFALPTASVVNGITPIARFPLASTANVQSFRFGRDGILVQSQDADDTLRNGCVLAVSSTATTLTLTVGAANNIRAFYP